jgi:hypothetical protein
VTRNSIQQHGYDAFDALSCQQNEVKRVIFYTAVYWYHNAGMAANTRPPRGGKVPALMAIKVAPVPSRGRAPAHPSGSIGHWQPEDGDPIDSDGQQHQQRKQRQNRRGGTKWRGQNQNGRRPPARCNDFNVESTGYQQTLNERLPNFSDDSEDASETASTVTSASWRPETAEAFDEDDILQFVISSYYGCCQMADLRREFPGVGLRDLTRSRVRRISVYRNESEEAKSIVFVNMPNLRLCAHLPHCRNGEECSYLHLCRRFVLGTCQFGERCRFGHDLGDEHNSRVAGQNGLDALCSDKRALLELVRCSNPTVCSAHNDAGCRGCSDPDSCLKLHVCNDFLHKKCLLLETECELGHDLFRDRNKKLLALYGINKKPTNDGEKDFIVRRILKINVTDNSRQANNSARGPSSNNKPAKNRANSASRSSVVNENNGTTTNNNNSKSTNGLNRTPAPERVAVPRRDMDVAVAGAAAAIKSQPLAETRLASSTSCEGVSPHGLHSDSAAAEFRQIGNGTSATLSSNQEGRENGNRCGEFEKHACDGDNDCRLQHGSESFVWRVRLNQKWIAFRDSRGVEQAYCDPQIKECFNTTFMVHI